MPKTRDIVAEIAASIVQTPPGSRPWWQRVDQAHAPTLAAIHGAWHRGEFGARKRTAARIIAKKLGEFGITIGEQGVAAWLDVPPLS